LVMALAESGLLNSISTGRALTAAQASYSGGNHEVHHGNV